MIERRPFTDIPEAVYRTAIEQKPYLALEPYTERAEILASIINWERFWDIRHTPQNALRVRLGFPATTIEEIMQIKPIRGEKP